MFFFAWQPVYSMAQRLTVKKKVDSLDLILETQFTPPEGCDVLIGKNQDPRIENWKTRIKKWRTLEYSWTWISDSCFEQRTTMQYSVVCTCICPLQAGTQCYKNLVLSNKLIKPNFCFDLSHWRSTTVSLETSPYETSRSAVDLQQICFDQNRSTADYFIVCRVCFQSAADIKLEYPLRC